MFSESTPSSTVSIRRSNLSQNLAQFFLVAQRGSLDALSVLKERENLGGKRTREPSARVNREAQGVIGARLRLVCPGSGSGWPAGLQARAPIRFQGE